MKQIIQKQNSFALLDGAAELGRNGLVIGRDLSFDEWTQLGAGLQALESGIQWVLGDWVNYGEARYGEKYAQAVDETGYTKHSLANFAWVAKAITTSRRREVLRFSHHAEVASLDVDAQEALLDKAVEYSLSVQALREAVKTYKGVLSAPPAPRELPAPPTVVSDHEPEPTIPSSDLVLELEAADKQIAELQAVNDSLIADDKDREIKRLHDEKAQISARLQAVLTEKAEATKDVVRFRRQLESIMSELGVSKFSDIIPAIKRRKAA